jgi:hypothetical protein
MKNKNYKACIVEESLSDNRILNDLKIVKVSITDEENSSERWHIYNSIVNERQIEELHKLLKPGWYVHFWRGNDMIVLFKGKKFNVKFKDKSTWKEAINYGLALKIPREQLDFVVGF